MKEVQNCRWCGLQFVAVTVGAHRKRFCSARCKNRFHSAARRWAEQALADGRLSLKDLRAQSASCTTPRGAAEAYDKYPRGNLAMIDWRCAGPQQPSYVIYGRYQFEPGC